MTAQERPKLAYTLDEVAEMTGLSRRSLADGCRAKKVPHRKLGQQRVMTPADVDRLLAQMEVAATTSASDPEVIRMAEHRERTIRRLAKRGRFQ